MTSYEETFLSPIKCIWRWIMFVLRRWLLTHMKKSLQQFKKVKWPAWRPFLNLSKCIWNHIMFVLRRCFLTDLKRSLWQFKTVTSSQVQNPTENVFKIRDVPTLLFLGTCLMTCSKPFQMHLQMKYVCRQAPIFVPFKEVSLTV